MSVPALARDRESRDRVSWLPFGLWQVNVFACKLVCMKRRTNAGFQFPGTTDKREREREGKRDTGRLDEPPDRENSPDTPATAATS